MRDYFRLEEKYKKENVTYFLYLARVYKKINKATWTLKDGTIKQKEYPPKWAASVNPDGQKRYLKYFKTEAEAALDYNKEAVRRYGEFANLNIIKL